MNAAPAWLAAFHRKWSVARGRRIAEASRAFGCGWVELLESAGLVGAEDQANAVRELERLEKAGRLVVKRHRYRKYLIERISLPVVEEAWLRGMFGEVSAVSIQANALEVVGSFLREPHPRFPGEWLGLCDALREAFLGGRSLPPFRWRGGEVLRILLDGVWNLVAREWPVGTPVRAASVEVGLDSKGLERHQRSYESGLSRLFGSATSFKDLGFVCGESHVELHGPVCLHFPDGSIHDFDGLSQVLISAADLARCTHATTTAERLLSIENRKTTFRQYAALNGDGRVLLAATSFPTPAFRELLEKLPIGLPHDHFGDTDPAGWHILLKLRESTLRKVGAFRMKWRPAKVRVPLTPYDRKLLEKLIASPLLGDVMDEIRSIVEKEDRGDFEQESLGVDQLSLGESDSESV
jgi:hypothetical protein